MKKNILYILYNFDAESILKHHGLISLFLSNLVLGKNIFKDFAPKSLIYVLW